MCGRVKAQRNAQRECSSAGRCCTHTMQWYGVILHALRNSRDHSNQERPSRQGWGQGKWIADVAPGLYGRSARVEFSPTQHEYAKTAVLVGEMRASSQEMPERKGASVRTGEPGAGAVKTRNFKGSNTEMELWSSGERTHHQRKQRCGEL